MTVGELVSFLQANFDGTEEVVFGDNANLDRTEPLTSVEVMSVSEDGLVRYPGELTEELERLGYGPEDVDPDGEPVAVLWGW